MVSLNETIYIAFRVQMNKAANDINRGLRAANRSVSRNGEDLGKAFSDGFNKGSDTNIFRRVSNGIREMVPAADAARSAFQTMVRTGYTLGTALTVVVGGISSLIGGLVALVGAAGGAAASLVYLANGFVALGLGAIAAKVALGGVGSALSKYLKGASTATGDASAASSRAATKAIQDAQTRVLSARRIEDAERALARTIERNRNRIVDANNDVRNSQLALNKAIKAGQEEIQQIGFDAEEAALAERRAGIDLENARQALARTQDLAPNDSRRKEAEQAYLEAELNYRKAKDLSADLNKEQDRLAKTGTNGLAGVIAARKKLAEAERAKAEAVKKAAQDEADALRDLEEAKADAKASNDKLDAGGPTLPSMGGAGSAWDDGLNDAQRRFVKFLADLAPIFRELKASMSEAFLGPLENAITILMDRLFPTIAAGMIDISAAMGRASVTIAEIVTESQNVSKLNALFGSSTVIIDKLAIIFGRLYDILLSILVGAAPEAEKFFGFIADKMEQFASYLNSEEGREELTTFFERASYTASLFGSVLGNVFGRIGEVIMANIGPGTGGEKLLLWLEEITQPKGDPEGLKQYFLDVATNVTKVLDSVMLLLDELTALGANQNIGKTFDILGGGAGNLGNILNKMADAGPSFAGLVVTLTKIVDVLTDTGAVEVFFDTLKNMADTVLNFISQPGVKGFLDFFGRIFAMFSAIGLATGLLSFGFKVVAGSITALLGPFAVLFGLGSKLGNAFKTIKTEGFIGALKKTSSQFDSTGKHKDDLIKNLGLFDKKVTTSTTTMGPLQTALKKMGAGFAAAGKKALAFMMGPAGIVIGVIAVLAAALYALYQNNEEFRKAVDDAWKEISGALAEAGAAIMSAIQPLIPVFVQMVAAIGPIVATLATSLVPVIKLVADVFVKLTPILTFVIDIFAKVLIFIIETVTAIIVGILDFITNFNTHWNNFWQGVSDFFGGIWDTIVEIFNGVLKFIVDAFLNWTVYGIIIKNWDAIVKFFGDVWKNIMKFFSDAWKWIEDYIIKPMGVAFDAVGKAFEALGNFFNDVWTFITDAFNVAWMWIERYIFLPMQIAFNLVGTVFDTVGKFIAGVWETMKLAMDVVWKWIDQWIFAPIRNAVDLVKQAFESSGEGAALAWEGLQTALETVWTWIDTWIFTPIKNAVSLVQTAFENTVAGIKTAWNNLYNAVRTPVNAVIDFVYNNGIMPFWNGIAGAFGLNDLKLSRVAGIPEKSFATGGVLPGYTPGRDVHRFYSPTGGILNLSGGEAIMRPEWVQMVGGPAGVERLNRAARGGRSSAGFGTRRGREQSFFLGGVFDFLGDTWENVTGFVSTVSSIVTDFLTDPMAAVDKHIIQGIVKPVKDTLGASNMLDVIFGIPSAIGKGIGSKIADTFGLGGETDRSQGGGQPMGWQGMWRTLSRVFPNATLNDSVRPAGTQTAAGGTSFHSLGRAIDTTASMEIFNWIKRVFPQSAELIYSPAGNRQLRNGREYYWGNPVRDMHFDHVHWALAKGGTVMPSPGGTIARIAEAGRAERVEPLDPNGLSNRDKAIMDRYMGSPAQAGVQINVYAQPNQDVNELAEIVSRKVSFNMRKGAVR